MEPRVTDYEKRRTNETEGKSQVSSPDMRRRKIYSTSDLDLDSDEDSSRIRVPMRMNLFLPLIPFVLFAIFDMVALLSGQFTALISLGIHLIFLPVLFYNARKISKGKVSFKHMATFYKSIFAYALIYVGMSITLSILIGDIFGLLIFILVGFQMFLWWARWKFIRKIFKGQN
jgi:hypothetical protein